MLSPRVWPSGALERVTFSRTTPRTFPSTRWHFQAVASVGGVNTTVNALYTADELVAQLCDCGARMLVTVPELLEKATAAAQRSGVAEIFVYGEGDGATLFASLLQARGEPPAVAIDSAEDLVALPIRAAPPGCPRG